MPWCCSLKSPPSDMCHSLLLFSLISSAEMENSITERIWFVTVRCLLFRLCSVGGSGVFFFSPSRFLVFFFLRDSVTVFACMLVSPPPALVLLPLKKKGMFSSKKKKKRQSREWENDKSLALCYWNILTALGSLTFYYKR